MIVITVTDCPPALRGDLTKWLFEVNTGVYIGNMNARIRDALWQRVCENLRSGHATIVFSAHNEQGMDFRVHNTSWEPVDYDGIQLMRRPSPARIAASLTQTADINFSNAAKWQKARAINAARAAKSASPDYIVIDVETTGVNAMEDSIIELAALKIEGGRIVGEFSCLVRIACRLPDAVSRLTGLTDEILAQNGRALPDALTEFLNFVGTNRVVCHNAAFDSAFLRAACLRLGMKPFANPCSDTLLLARKRVNGVKDYKLTTLAKHFSFDIAGAHNALADCRLTHKLYEKLNEIRR